MVDVGVGVKSSSVIDDVENSLGGYADVYNRDDESLSVISCNDCSTLILKILK